MEEERALADAVRSLSRRVLASEGADAQCPVCFHDLRRVRGAALVPCGHILCTLCRARVDSCPLCRRRVERAVALGCVGGSPTRFRTFWDSSLGTRRPSPPPKLRR